MRWLLLKDLQILRRSPLVTALLIGYPVVIGILIGFALSGDEGKPRVAFLNEVAEGESFDLGAGEDEFGSTEARDQLCDRVECVDVDSREEAEQMVEDGEVLGALILPEDLLDRLRSLTTLNPEEPTVEVLVNEDDPVKAQLVDDRISALITEANLVLSQRISEQAAAYIDLLIEGGTFTVPFLGDSIEILGLTASSEILTSVAEQLPPDRAGGARARDRVLGDGRGQPGVRAAAAGRRVEPDRGRQAGRLGRLNLARARSRSASRRR